MTTSSIGQMFCFGALITFMTGFSMTRAFTSIDEINIHDFVQMEGAMILKLQDNLLQKCEHLSQLKIHLIGWKSWRNSIVGLESEYITIPQNIFHLFKILAIEWNEFEATITKSILEKDLYEIKPPSEDHLKTIISSLIDQQYEYDIKPEYIMNATFKDIKPQDFCYLISKICFDNNNHRCATDWLSISLNLTSEMKSLAEIIKLLYSSYIFLNQTEIAYEYAKKSLNYDYFDTTNRHTIFELGSQLHKLEGRFYDMMKADRICRGEHRRPSKPNLKCRYNHDNSAFLKIAPLKEEELHDAPKVFFYRDVLYDSEIEFVKKAAAENMEVALLSGQSKPTLSYRVTESAFLNTNLTPLAALEKRTEDISNLLIRYSERWQVINYSPGGFYTTHSDYLPPDDIEVLIIGNRMTTMLFYINDVPLGGETVFPHINVSATPTKGAVLIWHNIHADGSKNKRADHCACPVIIGEKWGFTKWVRVLKSRQCLRSIYESDLKNFETKYAEKAKKSSIRVQ